MYPNPRRKLMVKREQITDFLERHEPEQMLPPEQKQQPAVESGLKHVPLGTAVVLLLLLGLLLAYTA